MLPALRPAALRSIRIRHFRPRYLSLVLLLNLLVLASLGLSPVVLAQATAVISINAGGGAAGSFAADEFVQGGSTDTQPAAINTSSVTSPAPQAVYQSERWGNSTYTLPGLTPGGSYTVRLHFAETYYGPGMPGGGGAGTRQFNVSINGTQVLTNFDIFSAAGGADIAIIKAYTAKADVNGNIAVAFTQGAADNAKVSGIEVLTSSPAPPAPPMSLTATPAYSAVVLNWNASAGALGYSVYRAAAAAGPYTVIGRPTGTAYTDAGLTNGTTYYYAVTASNMTGESGRSNQVSATPSTTVAPVFLSFTVNPSSVPGSIPTTGTVTLSGPAPGGGLTANFSSGNSAVVTPGNLYIPQGQTTDTVTINTSAVSAANTGPFYTTVGSVTLSTQITVVPITATISLSPPAVTGGYPATGTITLNTAAPGGGWTENLSSSNTGAVTLPGNVYIPQGQTTGTFAATTVPVSALTPVILSAVPASAGPTATATLTVLPTTATVTISPTSVTGGNPATGTVTLSAPAPGGGSTINFYSSNTGAMTAPGNYYMPAGQSTGTFAITTFPVSATTLATLSAVLNGVTSKTNLTVNPGSGGGGSGGGGGPGGGNQLTLTAAGVKAGFSLTTFASGFPTVSGQIGPLGITQVAQGILVADYPGYVRLFPTDTDNQVAGFAAPAVTPAASFGQTNADGLVTFGGVTYLTQQGNGQVVRLNPNGTPMSTGFVVAPVPTATGIIANPATGHLFVSGGDGSSQIWDVNPTTNTSSPWVSVGGADGLALSADNKTLYVATGGDILGFDVASRTIVWDYNATSAHTPIDEMDGIALGFGTLSGTIYANTNDGTVWQIALSNGAATLIASGGTRGDFVTPDTNNSGSLLLTQADRIMRLFPFAAAGTPPVALASVSVSPSSVPGGQSATGTVTLTGAAPAGGVVVTLSATSPAAVPASVLVAAGATTATFTITTTAVTATTTSTISAAYSGVTKTAPLTVTAPAPPASLSVSLSPSTVAGGATSTGTVTLSSAAPTGGSTVALSAGSPATVPASVLIAAGATTATFSITTLAVAKDVTVSVSASLNSITASAPLTIKAPTLVNISLSPSTLVGGSLPAPTATVTLSSAAPTGGLTVSLSAGSPATGPASVLVAAGATMATFSVATVAVATDVTVSVSASLNGSTVSAALTIKAPTLVSLVLNPSTVYGTQQSQGTVTISSPAPIGGLALQLSSDNLAGVPAIATVTIPQGATTPASSFTINTIAVATMTTSNIKVTLNGLSVTAPLTITAPTCAPAALVSLTLSTGSGPLTGTVTLSGPAQTGGQVVNLLCDTPSALTVPASVTVPANSASATFTLTPLAVFSSTPVIITAQYHDVVQQTYYTVIAATGGGTGTAPGGGPGGYDTGGMTLTPQAIARGFQLRTFATFPNYPADTAVTSSGKVLISGMLAFGGSSYVLPSDVDGQNGALAPPLPNNVWAVATIDGNSVYSSYGGVSRLDQNGNVIAGSTHSVPVAEDIAVDPLNGHIITDLLYDFDPVALTTQQITPGGGDGVAVTPDGQYVFVAGQPTGYAIASRAQVFPPSGFTTNGHYPDGMAAGTGALAGKIYSNDIDGTIAEYDINTGQQILIASGGTRGDLAKVDQTNGTFLLSQGGSGPVLPRLLRLIPPPGASFGALSGKIVATRSDRLWQYAKTMELPPTPPDVALTVASPALTGTTAKSATFDLVGLDGALAQGNMERAGLLQYNTQGAFDLQWGLQTGITTGNGATATTTLYTSYSAAQTSVQLSAADPHTYDVSWGITPDYLTTIQNDLGANFRAKLIDQVSSACTSYTIADTPHYSWPTARNTLTVLDSPLNSRIDIPAGRCLDMTLPGGDVPDNGAHWDILLNGQVVGSSGNSQGWDVEADHTLYHGVTVTVPASAVPSSAFGAPAANSYEVRFVRQGADDPYQSSGSAGFSVDPTDATSRAPLLRPVTLSLTDAPGSALAIGVTGAATLTGTVSLDAPAPEEGATIALTSSSSCATITTPNQFGYVTIPPGKTSAHFTVSTQPVSAPVHVQILASYNGYRVAALTVRDSSNNLPSAPVLGATPGNSLVLLAWTASSSATSYTLSRSTHKGGPYAPVFSGLTSTTYTDKGVTNGTTYYYVVTAANDYGSSPSHEASATPSGGQLPLPTFGSNPTGFNSTGSIQATISDAALATIHYTLDGSAPTVNSPIYSGPLTLLTSTTIEAIATKTGFAPSSVAAQQYLIHAVYSIVITPASCGFTDTNSLSAGNGTTGDGWSKVQGAGFYAHDYQFYGTAGTTVTLTVQGGSPPLDSVLFLMDPTGKVIAANTNGPNPQITITLPITATPLNTTPPGTGPYVAEVSTYAPGETGAYTFTLSCSQPQLVVLSGATAETSGASISFGSVAIGSSSSQALTLKNTGAAELDLTQIIIPAGFSLTQAPVSPIQPGQTTTMVLSFAPAAAQTYSGPLQIASNDPASPFTLTLTGTGTGTGSTTALASLKLTPDPVIGGQTVAVAVTLASAAPAGGNGVPIKLTKVSDPSSAAGLPAPVILTVPAGQISQTYNLTTFAVSAPATVTLSATDGTNTAQGLLTVQPAPLQPPTVTLTSPAPNSQLPAGTPVSLAATATAPSGTVAKVDFYATVNGGTNAKIGTATISPYTFVWPGVSGEQNATFTAVVTDSNDQTATSAAVLVTFTGPVLASLQLAPDPVIGGNAVTGTVTLAAPAPSGGATVSLTTNNATYTGLPSPATVTVPAGQTAATFTIATMNVTVSTNALISASLGGGTASVTLVINPVPASAAPTLASLRLSPDPVQGGNAVIGTVTLTGPAPTGGLVVSLTTTNSTNTGLPSPASVTVPAGLTSATFPLTTTAVTTTTNATIGASLSGATASVVLTIIPAPPTAGPALLSLQLSPDPVQGGQNVTGTVTLSSSAPSTGAIVVSLTTTDTTHTNLPGTVTVSAGASTATFTCATTSVTASTSAVITASYGGQSVPVTLVISPTPPPAAPALLSLLLAPDPVVGGNLVSGTVTLTGLAPTGGIVVSLTTSDPVHAQLAAPAQVTVAAGASTAAFVVATPVVTTQLTASIGASCGGGTASVALFITPAPPGAAPSIAALQLAPDPVIGGTTVIGTVTLATPAPAGGAGVSLITTDAVNAALSVSSVSVPAGQTTATFTVTTQAVSAQIMPSISASCGGGTATAVLTINPPVLTSLQLFPNPVAGGQSVTGTVTLTGPAPASGFPVTLIKGTDAGSVVGLPSPASVTVSAGQTSATFTLTTTSVTAPVSVTVSAAASGTSTAPAASATLAINPAAALTLACGQTVSGSLSAADITSTNPAFAGSGAHYAKRYTFTTTTAGNYILSPTATGFSPALSLISSSGYAPGAPSSGQAIFALSANTVYAFEISTASAGQTGSFQLRLDCPQTSGPAVLVVSSNGALVPTDPSFSGKVVDFGTTPLGVPVSQTFTLSNTGGTDLGITGLSVGGSVPDYKLVGILPSLIPAGGQATLTLQFNATNLGPAPANVIITDDIGASGSAASSYQFRITGTATGAGSLPSVVSVTPASPSVTGGSPQTETVTLSGGAPSGGLTVALAAQTLPAGSPSAASVPPTVTFSPGATTANFTVTTVPVSTATTVTLTASIGTASSASATLTVNPSGTPPTITLATNVAMATAPGSFILTATTTAATGSSIAKVEFFANGTKIGEGAASSSAPNSYVFNWNNVPASANPYVLTAKVTDNHGLTGTTTTSVSVTVQAAPVLTVFISPNGGTFTGPQSVTLAAQNGSGAAVQAAQILYTLDGNVWKTYTQALTIVQTTTVTAKAVAAGYANSAPVSATFTINPVSGGSLIAQMTMSNISSGGSSSVSSTNQTQALTISVPTPIQASISAASSWQLSYRLDGDSAWVPFATGTNGAAISGTALATWDTTLLVNGLYQVQLAAIDAAGHTAVAQLEVVVQGGQKVGYFTLSYNDLTVPVAGFPLSITRTYDSRMKTPGDFGIGWTLSTNNVRLQQSTPSGYNWTQVGQPGQTLYFNPVKPHVITLTMPDGTMYSFQEGLFDTSLSVFQQSDINETSVTYTPLPGTHGTLAPVGYGTDVVLTHDPQSDDPNRFDPNSITLEDLDGYVYKPTEFLLTTRDGRQFDVKAGSPQQGGGLQSIRDLNGNMLNFGPNGITSTTGSGGTGPAVVFTRTNNVITSISVGIRQSNGQFIPGPAITYVQNSNGDLASVADRVGNTTTYDYDPTHLLTGIHDPRGLTPLRNYYHFKGDSSGQDSDGSLDNRLWYSLDAKGNNILYNYSLMPGSTLPANTEATTDRLGNQTVLGYDGYGNVTSTTRTLMKPDGVTRDHTITTTMAYANFGGNNPDKKTSEVVQVNNSGLKRETDYNYDPLTGDLLTVTQYRTNGDPTSAITTTTTYNGLGQPLTVTDPLGHVVSKNNYDPNGNLMWTQDALHNETDFTYNTNGTLATTKDAKGNITQYAYNDPLNPANVTMVTDAQGHTTSFTYDLDGNKKTQTTTRLNGQGQTETLVTQFNYDLDDHLTQTIAPDSATSQTFYNSLGKVDHTLDALNRQTSYTYDILGNLLTTTYPDSTTTSVTYDYNGQRIASTDKAGRISASVYDSLGRVIQSGPASAAGSADGKTPPTWLTSGGTSQVSYTTYDDAGEVTAEADALGHTSQTTYDNLGRTQTRIDALNHKTTYAYDDAGRQLSVTDANNHTTSYDYDDAGRLTVTHYPDGITTSITGYNELGQRISQTDQMSHTTLYGYDTLGRLASVTDPMSHVSYFGYDALGEKISQTDANGHITQFAYDNRGRLISKMLPLLPAAATSPTQQYQFTTYDTLGRVSTQTDFNGKVTAFSYDPLTGRLMGKAAYASLAAYNAGTSTGESVSYTYNADGTRATATRTTASGGSVSTTYTYYPNGTYQQGQLQSVTTQATGGPARMISYNYDLLGNKTLMQTPGGSKIGYAYDALNRLFTVTHPDNAVTTFGYDRVGNRQSVSRATSATAAPFSTTSYLYDSLNRLTDIVNQSGGALVSSYHYGLRADGKRQSVTESGPSTNKGVTVYTYDDQGKLTQEAGPYATIAYTYDNVGNRLTRTVSASTTTLLPNGATTNTYDANDRLLTVNGSVTHTYDADGNETTVNGQTASYDFENHLVSLVSNNTVLASYAYDADGNRCSTYVSSNNPTTTSYVVDTSLPYASVVEEYSGTATAPSARYDYGDDLVRMDRGSGVYYYLFDGLGSTRQLVNTGGAVTDTWGYSAFGEMASHTGTTINPFLLNAQQFDAASGDYYLRARYYDQSNGRFISQDPFDGIVLRPISFHRYLYTSDDPENRIDPTGKFDGIGDVLATIAVASIIISTSITSFRYGTSLASSLDSDRYTWPDVTDQLTATVNRIEAKWDSFSGNPIMQNQLRRSLTSLEGGSALKAWDIEGLNAIGNGDSWIDRISGVNMDTFPDHRMVIVDNQAYHPYSVNYIAFGTMCRLTGISQTEMEALVAAWKLNPLYGGKDLTAAEGWADAGFGEWPYGASAPDSEISFGNFVPWDGRPQFLVRWLPLEDEF